VLTLSVLDQSPVPAGLSASEALSNSVSLARLSERLGFRRYWVAEHHNTLGLAGSAPEVMVARIASATSTIRVGPGGVMLPHYSPLKVAEVFGVLASLFPGRIDLGLGRAPGGDRLAAAALRTGAEAPFPQQVQETLGFLEGRLEPRHPFAPVRATLRPPAPPPVWLLGSSRFGAACAAALGTALSFAHFINPDDGPAVVEDYRREFRPSERLAEPVASVGVNVICAATTSEALRLAASVRLWHRRLRRGDPGPVPTVDEAHAELGETALRPPREDGGRLIVGDPGEVAERLIELAARYAVDELVVLTICHEHAARERSYELLAASLGATAPTAATAGRG
jgi:luciferase family oxidoreductase group 1